MPQTVKAKQRYKTGGPEVSQWEDVANRDLAPHHTAGSSTLPIQFCFNSGGDWFS